MFANDAERRAAWDERKDKLLEQRYIGESLPYYGHRPWAWWEYEVGRPDLWPVSAPDYDRSLSYAEREHINQEYELEKFTFLAEGGHLTDAEIERIARLGREAKERISAGWEEKAYLSPDHGGDRLRAARADAVQEALQ